MSAGDSDLEAKKETHGLEAAKSLQQPRACSLIQMRDLVMYPHDHRLFGSREIFYSS